MLNVHLFMLHSEFSFSWKGGVLYICSEILSPIGSASFAQVWRYTFCIMHANAKSKVHVKVIK